MNQLNAFDRAGTLLGHWPLVTDYRDSSGNGLHGHQLATGTTGPESNELHLPVVVPAQPALALGSGDFTLAAWVWTDSGGIQGPIGDVVGKYDASSRTGFTLAIKPSAGGYSSLGDDKHIYFGIDQGHTSEWQDCGRPSPYSNYVSNSLTVFDGHLYAATTDAARFEDWCHVFRYAGGQDWEDCGRVGGLRTHGVGPLIVHDGALHAATWNYDWTRVSTAQVDLGHVYRYHGPGQWEDLGQPGANRRLVCLASFQGRLYVGGDDSSGGAFKVFVHDGGGRWEEAVRFPMDGPLACFPHSMGVHDGKLYVSGIVPSAALRPAVHAFDGATWEFHGNPVDSNQVHSLEVYRGALYAGTWPEGRIARLAGANTWIDCGRPGDSTEINALCVYNGKFYAGSIPRGEVYRYEHDHDWTRLARFYSPEGWDPIPVDNAHIPDHQERVKEWTRVTSLTIFGGQLFASVASCTASVLDAPLDVRGKVFAFEAGANASYDRDLGSGWHHIAAVREGKLLRLYVDGSEQATSRPFEPAHYDLSSSQPLVIGSGELSPFRGRIRDVRLYGAALDGYAVDELFTRSRPDITG